MATICDCDTLKMDEPLFFTFNKLPNAALAPALMERRSPVAVVGLLGLQSILANEPEKAEKFAVEAIWKRLPLEKPVLAVVRYIPVPLVIALPALKTKAELVVVPVAFDEVNVCAPVPDVKFKAVAPVELPREMIRAVASVPRAKFPVLVSPIVKVCFAVVAKVPVALKYAAPFVPADTDAVGVPELTLVTANFALAVDVPPTKRSTVLLIGAKAPFV